MAAAQSGAGVDVIDDDGPSERVSHRRRWPRVLAVLVALVAAAFAVLWWQRKPIAEGFVARELARRGVAATYRLERVGLRTQRLSNVVIGDPANPDLTADWIEVYTDVGFGGAGVSGIAVGKAFLKARVTDGKVSLGALDRLMPAPSGKPFALPAISARINDARIRLTTDQGQFGMKLSGNGRLDDGFAGRLAVVAPRLSASGCTVLGLQAPLGIAVNRAAPSVTGPLRMRSVSCAGGSAVGIASDLRLALSPALDRWNGQARLRAERGSGAGAMATGFAGDVSFAGNVMETRGTARLGVDRIAAMDSVVRGARIDGNYVCRGGEVAFNGRTGAAHVAAPDAIVRRVAAYKATGQGTPIGPIAARLSSAAGAFARDFAASAAVEARVSPETYGVRVTQASLRSASGGRIELSGPMLRFGGVEIGGRIGTAGGGLPTADIALEQAANGAITGRTTMRPYEALGSRLALTPVMFDATADGTTHVVTNVTLSGPLADGRVEGLMLPIDLRWRGAVLTLNPRCTPLSWRRVAAAGLVLDPARLELCARDRALVTLDGGRVGGGARIGASNLTGRLGSAPLSLAAAGSELRLGEQGFSLTGVATRIGSGESVTRIDAERLDGRVQSGGLGGRFTGASGQIGQVPLRLSGADGEWRLVGGRLTLGGKIIVSDALDSAPRFKPMASEDVALTLVDSVIDATGTLIEPTRKVKIADVSIRHDLGRGTGKAALVVPGIVFSEEGLRPDDLTPLTFGVIASVDGTVDGRGDIAWTSQGVTSSGRFRTGSMDFAAAFGPVTGLSTEVTFDDLLNLATPEGQSATIAVANPGVPFENGTIRYHLLPGQKVMIESGYWPFAGGEMVLEPTLLDFGAAQERRMTFRVKGVQVAQFLQQFDFKNLNATGVVDGVLPMIFDLKGGRIESGELVARTGGSIEYVGEVSKENVGVWGNMAFQALRSLNYKELRIDVAGPLEGEMVTQIRFAGVNQGTAARNNLLSSFLIRRLARLPLVFNVTVRAPFRQLIDSVQSYYDPSRLIQRNLPNLIEEQRRQQGLPPQTPPVRPIQPAESEKRP